MKDAYYFSHDLNARNDPKILALRSVYGMEGYGRYWVLIEMMREQSDYRIMLSKYVWNALAMQMQCDASTAQKFVEDCINEFNLFESDGSAFWSNSLVRRMGKKDDKKESARKAAKARWDKERSKSDETDSCKHNANALQSHMQSIASNMQIKEEEKKEEERKENNNKKIYTGKSSSTVDNSVVVENFGRKDGNNVFPIGGDQQDVTPSSLTPEFVEFWNSYPRKSGKALAIRAWAGLIEKNIDTSDLIKAARKYAVKVKADKREEEFIKMPHNFLIDGVFKEYAPAIRSNCPYCHGNGYVPITNPDGTESMAECKCRRRFEDV